MHSMTLPAVATALAHATALYASPAALAFMLGRGVWTMRSRFGDVLLFAVTSQRTLLDVPVVLSPTAPRGETGRALWRMLDAADPVPVLLGRRHGLH
jgi:hypothetical protein